MGLLSSYSKTHFHMVGKVIGSWPKVLAMAIQLFYCSYLFGADGSRKEVLVSWDKHSSWDLVTGGTWIDFPEVVLFNDGTFLFTQFGQASEKVSVRMRKVPPEEMSRVRNFLLQYLDNMESSELLQAKGQVDDVALTTITIQIGNRRKVLNLYGMVSEKSHLSLSPLSELLASLKSADTQEYISEGILLFIREVEDAYIKNYRGRLILKWNLHPALEDLFSGAKTIGDKTKLAKVEGKDKAILTAYLQDKVPFSRRENRVLFKRDGKYYEILYRPVLPTEFD